jgi:hypothetical protein
MSQEWLSTELTRRDALGKATYVAPLILTLAVMPSFAAAGSVGKNQQGQQGPQQGQQGQQGGQGQQGH